MEVCRDSSCNYRQRLVRNIRSESVAGPVGGLILSTTIFALSCATGGLAALAIFGLSAGSMLTGDLLIENNEKKTVKEIENELKEK